jgi:predicted dienelactone hydrolase
MADTSSPEHSHQWIATDLNDQEYLVTVWEIPSRRSPTGKPILALEVSPRLDHTRWGRPFMVKEIS